VILDLPAQKAIPALKAHRACKVFKGKKAILGHRVLRESVAMLGRQAHKVLKVHGEILALQEPPARKVFKAFKVLKETRETRATQAPQVPKETRATQVRPVSAFNCLVQF
jgi:hypothetical protein